LRSFSTLTFVGTREQKTCVAPLFVGSCAELRVSFRSFLKFFDDHDAEDAFQATFLVLLVKAGTLRIDQTLGPWLHAVAYRTAPNSRRTSTRRRSVERAAAVQAVTPVRPESFMLELEVNELGGLLHQAIRELPTRFRSAVLLCDFEGLSYLEAAVWLGIPLGTLQSRLGRARRRLRDQLNRQSTISPAMGSRTRLSRQQLGQLVDVDESAANSVATDGSSGGKLDRSPIGSGGDCLKFDRGAGDGRFTSHRKIEAHRDSGASCDSRDLGWRHHAPESNVRRPWLE
jgi:RNA polymerase sigma factor (sigma-70 family)